MAYQLEQISARHIRLSQFDVYCSYGVIVMPRKAWDQMNGDEKLEELRIHIQDFIAFYNNSVIARNTARDQLTARLDALEAAVKRIEAEMDHVLNRVSA